MDVTTTILSILERLSAIEKRVDQLETNVKSIDDRVTKLERIHG